MKLRKPWMTRLAGRIGARVMRAWTSTLRCRADFLGQNTDARNPSLQERFIYAMWHEEIFGMFAFRSVAPITVLVSPSADGDILTQMLQSYGIHTVRGSSTQGGLQAVDEVLKLNMQSHLVVAPDGPRGPQRKVKRGIVYLSSWTQLPIVPLGLAFRRAWRVKSRDRTFLPVPGTMLCVVGGPIITVPAGLDKWAMEAYRVQIERTITTASDAAQAWAQGRTPQAQWPSPIASAA